MKHITYSEYMGVPKWEVTILLKDNEELYLGAYATKEEADSIVSKAKEVLKVHLREDE